VKTGRETEMPFEKRPGTPEAFDHRCCIHSGTP
jgi:hypothetical protein